MTPLVYYFYDNHSEITYSVDKCRRRICEAIPHGRILDCTDHVLYDIEDRKWCPICDLRNKEVQTVVLCNTVPFGDTSAAFNIIGRKPVISPFSEIPEDRVVFNHEIATVSFNADNLPIGGCSVLLFTVCFEKEELRIAKIFIRGPGSSVQRFSAQGGAFGNREIGGGGNAPPRRLRSEAVNANAVEVDLPAFPPPQNIGVVPIAPWSIKHYDRPTASFDLTTGFFVAPASGDYNINAVLTYNCNVPIGPTGLAHFGPHLYLPRFVLVKNRNANNPGFIVFDAPVDAQVETVVNDVAAIVLSPPPASAQNNGSNVFPPCGTAVPFSGIIPNQYNLAEQGQAVISIGLHLLAGESLTILYLDDINCYRGTTPFPGELGAPVYLLDPLGTTFKVELLG